MKQTEVLIIGGGIAGTATAYHLTQSHSQVTLLERSEIAAGASGLNAGTIWATGWGTVPTLSSTLSMGSLDILRMLQSDLVIDIEFQRTGSLKIIQTEEEYEFAQQEVMDLTTKGYSAELLTLQEARILEPELNPAVPGCLYYPHGGNAHPVKTTRAFAVLAQQQGANILTNSGVTDIHYLDDGTYQVTTDAAMFQTKILILAAGPDCRFLGSMLGLNIPVYAVRGQMWSTGPVPPKISHSVGATESSLYWHKNPTRNDATPQELTHEGMKRLTRHLYGRQTRDGEIIIGGDRQIQVDDTPDCNGIETNYKHAIELFPFLQNLPITRIWAGWMPFTLNLQPMIGRIPEFENLYILTGLSSSGFEQGAMAGKLLAESISNYKGDALLSEADPAKQITKQ